MRQNVARVLSWVAIYVTERADSRFLSAAAVIQHCAARVAGPATPEYPLLLANLAVIYEQMHKIGHSGALEASITILSSVVAVVPEGDPARVTMFSNLGAALTTRFEGTQDPKDLDHALQVLNDAETDCPKGHPDRDVLLINTATAMLLRVGHPHWPMAGERALRLCAEAATIVDPDTPTRADLMTLRGQIKHTMSEVYGGEDELDDAIKDLRDAVALASRTQGDRSHARAALARSLRLRAHRQRRGEDLTTAIDHLELALAETPRQHKALRDSRVASLAIAYASRVQWTDQPAHLDRAIALFEELVARDGSRAARHRANLAVCLTERADSTHAEPRDLDRAVEMLRNLTVAQSPNRGVPELWTALADGLLDRAEASDSPSAVRTDLEEALRAATTSVAISTSTAPAHATVLTTLAEVHLDLYQLDQRPEDLDSATRAYASAVAVSAAPARDRIAAALLWGHCAATGSSWGDALEAHDRGGSLVHRLLVPDLQPLDGLRIVEDLAEAGTDALALSVLAGQPGQGLVRAEQWRSLILGPDRLRRQLWVRLQAEHPHLEQRLRLLAAQQEAARHDPDTLTSRRHP